jgi:hypothetical protein
MKQASLKLQDNVSSKRLFFYYYYVIQYMFLYIVLVLILRYNQLAVICIGLLFASVWSDDLVCINIRAGDMWMSLHV